MKARARPSSSSTWGEGLKSIIGTLGPCRSGGHPHRRSAKPFGAALHEDHDERRVHHGAGAVGNCRLKLPGAVLLHRDVEITASLSPACREHHGPYGDGGGRAVEPHLVLPLADALRLNRVAAAVQAEHRDKRVAEAWGAIDV